MPLAEASASTWSSESRCSYFETAVTGLLSRKSVRVAPRIQHAASLFSDSISPPAMPMAVLVRSACGNGMPVATCRLLSMQVQGLACVLLGVGFAPAGLPFALS